MISDNAIDLPNDPYWTTLPSQREKILENPIVSIGYLSKDWHELQKLSQKKLATIDDINRFANILIAIGEAVLQKDFAAPESSKKNIG